jgi:Tol biopolymer transport system component
VLPVDGGSPIAALDLLPGGMDNARWTPDGKGLVSAVTSAAVGNLWLQNPDGTRRRQITDFKSDLILDFAWSSDGQRIALARGKSSSDVVLIRNFR